MLGRVRRTKSSNLAGSVRLARAANTPSRYVDTLVGQSKPSIKEYQGVEVLARSIGMTSQLSEQVDGNDYRFLRGWPYVDQTNLHDFFKREKRVEQRFRTRDGFVKHPGIRDRTIIAREFQLNIASRALDRSTLVVLPTGIGKTIIAILVAADKIAEGEGRILMVAPTRPLVEQHLASFLKFMTFEDMVMFTGSLRPDRRVEAWSKARIVFSTPQTIFNDLEKGRYDLSSVSLLIIDEAHRTVGDYAYTGILSRYSGQVLALTASPGGDNKKIAEVIENLGIDNIEVRTETREDVREHVKGIEIEWVRTELPDELLAIRRLIMEYLGERIRKLRRLGFLRQGNAESVSKKNILKAREEIMARYSRNKGLMFGSLHNQGQAVLADHMMELLETQGAIQCQMYIDRMRIEEKLSKAEKGFLNDSRIVRAASGLGSYRGPTHPKLMLLEEIVRRSVEKSNTVIVFTQIRDTIPLIMDRLKDLKVERFVGQSKGKDGKGLKQKDQKDILDRVSVGGNLMSW